MDASFVLDLIVWLTWVVAGAALLSVGAALTGRWTLGRRAARNAVLGMLAYPLLTLLMLANALNSPC